LCSRCFARTLQDFRIVLKLHYAIYPRGLAALGHVLHFLNVRYNELFRALFLFTLTPKENSFSGLVGEYAVNGGTVLYNSIDKYMGYNNLLYVGTLGAVAFVLDCYPVFLVGTSYVHYCRYISTYYIRKNVNYGLFKRDVLFFKGVMLLQMLRLVMGPFADGSKDLLADMNFVGLAMIVGGYLVSMAATAALGVDGTYFGIELGFVKADYMFVNSFPYVQPPHPGRATRAQKKGGAGVPRERSERRRSGCSGAVVRARAQEKRLLGRDRALARYSRLFCSHKRRILLGRYSRPPRSHIRRGSLVAAAASSFCARSPAPTLNPSPSRAATTASRTP
jgi:hypothetical protein